MTRGEKNSVNAILLIVFVVFIVWCLCAIADGQGTQQLSQSTKTHQITKPAASVSALYDWDLNGISVGNLTFLPTLISGQPQNTVPASTDFLLSYDTTLNRLEKVQNSDYAANIVAIQFYDPVSGHSVVPNFQPLTGNWQMNIPNANSTLVVPVAPVAGQAVIGITTAGVATLGNVGGAPGGSNGNVQYNNSGSMGGASVANISGAGGTLTVTSGGGHFVMTDNTDTTKTIGWNLTNIPTATNEVVVVPNSANPVIVAANSGSAHNWVTGISSAGVVSTSQPGVADLSSSTSAQLAAVLSDETGSSGGGVVVFNNSPSITGPTIASGLTASGSTNNDFSGSTGGFKTSSGANQLTGAVTEADATTPSITTAAGKTNTGFLQINGKTSGALKLTVADAMAQNLTITTAAQTVGAATLTIPDQASVSSNFVFDTLTQTLSGKTLTSPVISAGLTASGSASNDFSSSTGTFKTSTGAVTLGGATTIADATTPSLTTAAGKTNTGFVQINGKTSGATKYITADATAQNLTVSTAAQTVGAATLTIPDQVGVNRNLVTDTGTQTITNKTFDGTSTYPTFNQNTTGKSATTDALNTTGTAVNVAAAATPAASQVLTATDNTHATWQTPGTSGLLGIGAGLTSDTTVSNQQTPTTGGVTLASQTLATGSMWHIHAWGDYTSANSATARNLELQPKWNTTNLTKVAMPIKVSTALTASWQYDGLITATSTTAAWVSAFASYAGTSSQTAINGTATSASNTSLSSGAQTLDFTVDTSASVVGDSIVVKGVIMMRIK